MVAVPIGDTAGSVSGMPRRGIGGRLSSGHLSMIVAGLAGAVLAFAALRQEPPGTAVAVAARQIRAGEAVRPRDLRVERVHAPHSLLSTFVPAAEISLVRGRIAVATLEAGEVVVGRNLRPRAARRGLRAMSIPIDPSLAVAGRLAPGDRIDVLVAADDAVSIVVGDAEVVAVDAKGRGGIGETSSPFTVTVAVDVPQSQALAAAIADGNLSIARTTGAEPSGGATTGPRERSGGADATSSRVG